MSPSSSVRRYNANRAPQAQSKIKILEKLPALEPPEEEESMTFKFAEADKLSPPLLQLDEASFGYIPERLILKNVSIDIDTDSRHGIIGPNGWVLSCCVFIEEELPR
jgi:ATP-binding cassette subfamily F protein 3